MSDLSPGRGRLAIGCASAAFWGLCALPATASHEFQDSWRPFRDPTIQDHGFQWSRVGDPHNPNALVPPTFPTDPPVPVGRVNYRYRVMTREVSYRQWYEFVQAYRPYVAFGTAQSPGLIGPDGVIQYHGYSNGLPVYSLDEESADQPARANWRHVARFANWLNADQADAAWAFETGVYDTSTFGTAQNDQGLNYFTDQQARAEGARFFIPTFDEWTKAGHWDPDRFGDDLGGWWLYPTTSDTVPVSGHPDLGGETNGGPFPPGQVRPLDVGSYPFVQSPWGLLDVSGGAHEWMEDAASFVGDGMPATRLQAGSSIYQPQVAPEIWDALGRFSRTSPSDWSGIRLASVIPAPGSVPAAVIALGLLARRIRPCGTHSSWSRPP